MSPEILGLIGLTTVAAGLAALWWANKRWLVSLGAALLIIGWLVLIVFGTAAHGRELGRSRVAHPAGCPRAWCGCYLASYLGISDRRLWQARAWAHLVGTPASGPQAGAIVVWPHHVGLIRAVEGNRILVLSGNDGHAVRERWRTTKGVIAYRIREGFRWPWSGK